MCGFDATFFIINFELVQNHHSICRRLQVTVFMAIYSLNIAIRVSTHVFTASIIGVVNELTIMFVLIFVISCKCVRDKTWNAWVWCLLK